MRLVYPWPLAIWIVAVLISVQYRFPLQRRLLGMIRIHRVLTIIFTISMLSGTVYALVSIRVDVNTGHWGLSAFWDCLNIVYCCSIIVCFFVVRFNVIEWLLKPWGKWVAIDSCAVLKEME